MVEPDERVPYCWCHSSLPRPLVRLLAARGEWVAAGRGVRSPTLTLRLPAPLLTGSQHTTQVHLHVRTLPLTRYICTYAPVHPELSLLAINTLQKVL